MRESMKIFHIADLHLGKRVNEFDMLDAQRDILSRILLEIETYRPTALIIAGDIYDHVVPSGEAIRVFNEFLNGLQRLNLKVYIVSGNHDSKERLNFASGLLSHLNFHIASFLETKVFKDSIDENVDIYMIPFLRPADVRTLLNTDVKEYEESFRKMVDLINLDSSKFNILVSHQFFTFSGLEPEKSDSEIFSVGSLDNIDVSAVDKFDYVALGHIHRPQYIGYEHIRYAGSILKYSQSEVSHLKSITVLDIDGKDLSISTINLKPQQDMVHVKGYLEDILGESSYNPNDYTYVTLLDENPSVDALARLRKKFPFLMSFRYDNLRSKQENSEGISFGMLKDLKPLDLFNKFYERQNNQGLTEDQYKFVTQLMEDVDETN